MYKVVKEITRNFCCFDIHDTRSGPGYVCVCGPDRHRMISCESKTFQCLKNENFKRGKSSAAAAGSSGNPAAG